MHRTLYCPVSDWTVNYYEPISRNLKKMEERYRGNTQAMEAVQNLRNEITLYKNILLIIVMFFMQ